MKIIRFMGGLGNQLFQYAYYRKMQQMDRETFADLTAFEKQDFHYGLELEKVFGVELRMAQLRDIKRLGYTLSPRDRLCRKFLPRKKTFYSEKVIGFDRKLNDPEQKDAYLEGYWHSYRYFLPMQKQLQEELQCHKTLSARSAAALLQIRDGNSAAVHIRRKDFLDPKNSFLVNLSETEYYGQALKKMQEARGEVMLYVFSDDMEWAKEHIALKNTVYVDWNRGEESWQDMILMSYCRSAVIANSTFSWWGAWLNPQGLKKYVICPRKWYSVTAVKGRRVQEGALILPAWETL